MSAIQQLIASYSGTVVSGANGLVRPMLLSRTGRHMQQQTVLGAASATVLAADNFNVADTAGPDGNHTAMSGGGTWAVATDLGIASNKGIYQGSSGQLKCTTTLSQASYTMTCTTNGVQYAGLFFRASDVNVGADHYFQFQNAGSSTYTLNKFTGGTATSLGTPVVDASSTVVLSVTVDNSTDTITAKANGVTVYSGVQTQDHGDTVVGLFSNGSGTTFEDFLVTT